MVPLDERAAQAVRARGGSELAAWLAAVGGGGELRVRVVDVDEPAGTGLLSTPEVAAAVDRGRDAAGAAAREGVSVLAARGADGEAAALARWLAGEALGNYLAQISGQAPDPEIRGPLGALRRLGTPGLCVLTGLALGAGEHGLGFVGEGIAATAAAAVAVAAEPDAAARVRVADLSHPTLGLEALVERGGLAGALAALQSAAH